ncbi:hypothetical protein [Flavobacterium sp.]|uniref:hypothetical protein n=1 Tax=Flavobacterium sp. TaxID=239 RepID=UPI003D6B9EBA
MSSETDLYVIRCSDDLLYLKSVKSIFYRFNAVKFDMRNLDSKIASEWEQKINQQYKACGCGEGNFFVFIFFLIALGWKYAHNQLFLNWSTSCFVFLMCLLGAFLGKAFGQYLAFRKLKRIINKLESSDWNFYC